MRQAIINQHGDSSESIQIIIVLQTKLVLITTQTYHVVDGRDHAVNYALLKQTIVADGLGV